MNNSEISLDVLPKESDRVFEELRSGNMVIARSKDDFLYILDFENQFHMFSHTAGAPGGGQKQFPKNEKYRAAVRKIVDMADAVFTASYDKGLNIYGVMAAAEDAVLSMFPSGDRDADADIEFKPWDRGKSADEIAGSPDMSGDPFGYFNPHAGEDNA